MLTFVVLLVCGILTLVGFMCANVLNSMKDKPTRWVAGILAWICHAFVVALVWAAL